MRDVYLGYFTYALGNQMQTVEQAVEQGLTLSTVDVLKAAGFQTHYTCPPEESAYDLVKEALTYIPPGHLQTMDAIVYATCLPLNGNLGSFDAFVETGDVKHLMDFPASHLQDDFNLPNATVIGVNQQACTGMLGALRLARALLKSEPELKDILCVTADRFPEGAIYEQAYNLISDGAAGCVATIDAESLDTPYRLLACHGRTNGAMVQASDDETVGSYFNYTFQVIQETLAKAGLTARDIDWIVPQNTHANAWQILAKLLDIKFDRVYFPTIAEAGHVISGDNMINLKHLEDAEVVKSGDRVLLFMAGYGLNWQCTLLQKV